MYISPGDKQAFGYMRVSGTGQADGDGFERQRLAIEKYAAARGIQIVDWFDDVQTGKDEWRERPGWSRMIAALNGVRVILVEKLDRVARRVLVQELILADLRKIEVTLLSSAGDDTSDEDPERVMFRQILAVFAEYERTMIVRKLRGARDRKKAATGRCDGRKPYGFHADEARVLTMVEDWRREGFTFHGCAYRLNQMGLVTRYGRSWRATTLAKIMGRQTAAVQGPAVQEPVAQ